MAEGRFWERHKTSSMSNGDLGWITNFIWNIADDVLRDLYVRGKYRDVILPMTVLRRRDGDEGDARSGGHCQPGVGATPGRRPRVLQCLPVYLAGPEVTHEPAAA